MLFDCLKPWGGYYRIVMENELEDCEVLPSYRGWLAGWLSWLWTLSGSLAFTEKMWSLPCPLNHMVDLALPCYPLF